MSTPKPSVLIANRSYWPDAEATGQLLTDLSEFLVPSWDVEVLVGQPNRIVGDQTFQKSGVESKNGVKVNRLTHFSLPKRFPAARMANLVSFSRKAKSSLRKRKQVPDIVVSETDPFLLPPVVADYSRKTGCKFVAYLQDIYPDIAVALGKAKEGTIVKRIRESLRSAYQHADRVIVLDDDMKERLVGWGIEPNKIRIVPNWVDVNSIEPVKSENQFRIANDLNEQFVVMHSGNMGLSQNLNALMLGCLRDSVPNEIALALVGDGANRIRLQELAAEKKAGNRVRFFDYQPRNELGKSLSAADLHVVSMDARIKGCLAPSKLYGILASATPILAIVPKGSDVWQFVESESLGWVVEPGDVAGISQAVRAAFQTPRAELITMGARGRQIASERFDANRCMKLFEQVLEEVLAE